MDLELLFMVIVVFAVNGSKADLVNLTMSGADPQIDDAFICSSFDIKELNVSSDDGFIYIRGFHPLADANVAHHIEFYTCNQPKQTPGNLYDCVGNDEICEDKPQILYSWATNGDAVTLPENVSMYINISATQYLILQIHYAKPLPEPDTTSTIELELATER